VGFFGDTTLTTNLTTPTAGPQAAQVAPAKKAAALKAGAGKRPLPAALSEAAKKARRNSRKADLGHDQHDKHHFDGARAPPAVPVRLLGKREICAIAGVTYQVVWKWMRAGSFPRSRVVGGKSKWLSSEIDQWLANLPVRQLKGDAKTTEAS
jgi:predicted DNA-binding transcriptional regulator AlpA